jgi:hypothetical protein
MTVYVDNMQAPFGNMIMCHMFADSSEELLEMADKRKWIQFPGTYKEHFDIALTKRRLAINFGAKEVDWMDFGRHTEGRKPK